MDQATQEVSAPELQGELGARDSKVASVRGGEVESRCGLLELEWAV